MATKRDVRNSIAATFLTGDGLAVSQRIIEAMLTEAAKSNPIDLPRIESLGKLSGEVRKLKDADATI